MEERFWPKVTPTGFCWEWNAATDARGYGVFNLGSRLDRAHRVAWTLLIGEIPAGLVLDHLCRNQSCCNPDHLEPVTQLENMRRNRLPHCQRGHSMDDAYERPDGNGRMCRTCSDARGRRRWRGNSKKAS